MNKNGNINHSPFIRSCPLLYKSRKSCCCPPTDRANFVHRTLISHCPVQIPTATFRILLGEWIAGSSTNRRPQNRFDYYHRETTVCIVLVPFPQSYRLKWWTQLAHLTIKMLSQANAIKTRAIPSGRTKRVLKGHTFLPSPNSINRRT